MSTHHWQNIVALMMLKQGVREVRFSPAEDARLSVENLSVVADLRQLPAGGNIIVRLVDEAEVARLRASDQPPKEV